MPATLEQPQTNGALAQPPTRRPPSSEIGNGGFWAAFAMLLGFLVVVLGAVAIWMGVSAHGARKDAQKAATAATGGSSAAQSMPGMDMSGGSTSQSFAGQGPANAAE